jgi:hypothetical protein
MSLLEKKVWEILSEFNNISEERARIICHDMSQDDEPLPADELAYEHIDMLTALFEVMESPDIRESLLYGNDQCIQIHKIPHNEVNLYLKQYKGSYYCSICRREDENNTDDTVSLSCMQNNCKSIFCKECIVPWITECCARCPNCREPVVEIASDGDVSDVKHKIVICIKKKETK